MQEHGKMDPVTVVVDTQVGLPPVYAWSAEDSGEWRTPTMEYRPPKADWRKAVKLVLIPSLIAAALILGYAWPRSQHQEGPRPAPVGASHMTVDPAPPPNPDQDDEYINMIVESGLGVRNRKDLIAGGHWVCSYLGLGHTQWDIITQWDEQTQPGDDAALLHNMNKAYVNAAIKAYCPQLG